MNYLDLFSGIGGFHQGLREAGLEFQWEGHSEINKYAKSIYQRHFKQSEYMGDIRTIKPASLPSSDQWIITGGWPCQDNSIAGKRQGQSGGTRSGLFSEIIRILRSFVEMGTQVIFIGENVPGLFSVNGGLDFLDTITRLTILDSCEPKLNLECQLCNTLWFLPQNRERIIFIGSSRNRSRTKVFPLFGESSQVGQQSEVFDCAQTLLSRDYQNYKGSFVQRVGVVNYDAQGNRIYSVDGVACAQSAQGGGWGAKTGLYAVPTIRSEHHNTADVHFIAEGHGIRRLVPLECERLFGFPDNWTKYGHDDKLISDSQRYKCIGNSVTVPLIKAIGKDIVSETERRSGRE